MIDISPHIAGQITRLIGTILKLTIVAVLIILAVAPGPAVAQKRINPEATTRLFESIEENNLRGVKINTIGGADLLARNRQDMTPIDLAIDKGYFDIVYYLLAYRDSRRNILTSRTGKIRKTPPENIQIVKPASVKIPSPSATVTNRPQQPQVKTGIHTPPPVPPSGPVIVVAPDPPAPGLTPPGPSPFDPDSRAPGSGLTIIGDIRGPPGPPPAIKSEPVKNADPVRVAMVTATATKPVRPITVPKTAATRSVLYTTPPHKPSPPARKITDVPASPVPAPARPSPLFDEPEAPPVVTVTKQIEPPVTVAPAKPPPPPQIKAPAEQPPPRRELAAVETALPGKPKDDRGFFEKIMSALSFGGDDQDPERASGNRVVMDMPPPLRSRRTPGPTVEGDNGWAVRKIERSTPAGYPENPALPITDRAGPRPVSPLKNISLSLINGRGLGQPLPKRGSAEFGSSCIEKKSGSLVFCIIELKWPDDIAGLFAISTILYEGTKTIVRYDEGAATYYHTLFPTGSFTGIVEYFTSRYGPPTKTVERSIAPLAAPRMPNQTVIWRAIAPVTGLLTTLEIRTFDDARGGFPDTRRGVILLYQQWSRPVFPDVSTVELMMLSANRQR